MSDWTVHLEFEEGTSSKFWRARTDGQTLYVNYGKIGSAGQTQVKDFGDAATATVRDRRMPLEPRLDQAALVGRAALAGVLVAQVHLDARDVIAHMAQQRFILVGDSNHDVADYSSGCLP